MTAWENSSDNTWTCREVSSGLASLVLSQDLQYEHLWSWWLLRPCFQFDILGILIRIFDLLWHLLYALFYLQSKLLIYNKHKKHKALSLHILHWGLNTSVSIVSITEFLPGFLRDVFGRGHSFCFFALSKTEMEFPQNVLLILGEKKKKRIRQSWNKQSFCDNSKSLHLIKNTTYSTMFEIICPKTLAFTGFVQRNVLNSLHSQTNWFNFG